MIRPVSTADRGGGVGYVEGVLPGGNWELGLRLRTRTVGGRGFGSGPVGSSAAG